MFSLTIKPRDESQGPEYVANGGLAAPSSNDHQYPRKEKYLTERESREQFASALRTLGSRRDPSKMRAADWFVRGLLAFDAALLVLTVVPPFSAIWSESGLARLFADDRFRAAGFRADVVWMFWSTVVICVAGLRPTVESGAERTTSNLCWKWLACFFFYLCYVVLHMF